jgi:Glycosyltransferase family 87
VVIDLRQSAWFNFERVNGYAKCIAFVFLLSLAWFFYDAIYLRGSDFQAFWSAARLLVQGGPDAAYDLEQQRALQVGMPTDGFMAFVHPPPFLLFIAPLGLLSYSAAFLAWNIVTFVAWVVAAYLIERRALWPIIAFPAALLALAHAQIGLLIGALICASVAAGTRRPWLAGFFIGALVIKPQIAVLLPLAIILAREPKIFISAACSSVLFLLLGLVVFGAGSYSAFWQNIGVTSGLIAAGEDVFLQRMATVYSAVRLLLSEPSAIIAQACSALFAIAALIYVGRKSQDFFTLMSAALTATCLTLPYLFSYDLPFLIVPCIWLGVQGSRHGWLDWEKLSLAVVYWGVLFGRAAAIPLGFNPTPIMAALLLILIVRRVRRANVPGLTLTGDPSGAAALSPSLTSS